MSKAEKAITNHISKMNGLTNPVIASWATGYAISTCKRIFKKYAYKDFNQYFLITN